MTHYAQIEQHLAEVVRRIEEDPRFARVAAVHAQVDGEVLCDQSWSANPAHDLFSVTKTIMGVLTGVALEHGLLPSLDDFLDDVLTFEAPPSLTGQRVRHLLTMTRGAAVDGEWDFDAIAALEEPWGPKIAAAPRRAEPGAEFRYDNGGVHLLACLLHRATGDLGQFADEHLFSPLMIDDWSWARDPGGVPIGTAHLAMPAPGLAAVGQMLLEEGTGPDGGTVVSREWVATMRSPTSGGGPPEMRKYGHLVWLENDGTFFGAGWAGNLLLVRPPDRLVVVTLADTGFTYGPPVTDQMPDDWQAPLQLIRDLVPPTAQP